MTPAINLLLVTTPHAAGSAGGGEGGDLHFLWGGVANGERQKIDRRQVKRDQR
jgi:hypothetical protein